MLRHLPRLAEGSASALVADRLRRADLCLLQPYQPSLSAAWLFQRSMSLRMGQLAAGQPGTAPAPAGDRPQPQRALRDARLSADHINRVLACNFGVMRSLGAWVLRPFLQDTVRLLPLTLTMSGMLATKPLLILRVVAQVCVQRRPPGDRPHRQPTPT